MRVIWTARLVIVVAAAMLLGSAAFAAYQSGGTAASEQASAAGTASPTHGPTTPRSVPPATNLAPTPPRPPEVTGRATTSGPFEYSYTGRVNITSNQYARSCADLAAGAFLIGFSHDQQLDYRLDHLSINVSLPNGTFGPGTYSLATTRLSANGSWQREGLFNQLWTVKPGLSRATLQLRPNASGMITATDLTPLNSSQTSAPANLQKNLSFTLIFSCS